MEEDSNSRPSIGLSCWEVNWIFGCRCCLLQTNSWKLSKWNCFLILPHWIFLGGGWKSSGVAVFLLVQNVQFMILYRSFVVVLMLLFLTKSFVSKMIWYCTNWYRNINVNELWITVLRSIKWWCTFCFDFLSEVSFSAWL